MKKLYPCFLIFLLILNAFSIQETREYKDIINEKDQIIKNYEEELQEYKNKTYSLKEMFQIAAEVYDIDFKMLYAIARLETGNFTSSLFVNNNNPGGIKDFDSESGWASYETQFKGVMEMARLLKRNYINKGLTTPETIGPIYCPNSDTWATKIRDLMSRS